MDKVTNIKIQKLKNGLNHSTMKEEHKNELLDFFTYFYEEEERRNHANFLMRLVYWIDDYIISRVIFLIDDLKDFLKN